MKSRMSTTGLLTGAIVIAALYGAAHVAGLREDTTILSGTAPPGGEGGGAVALGLLYVVLHFAAVVGAPILALGGGLLWGIERALRPPPDSG